MPDRPKKLVLAVIDSLKPDMLDLAIEEGRAPTLATLRDRGTCIRDCISTFPSVTPVASAAIATGQGPGEHHIPSMNWYHRGEERYIEYGSSFPATRAFGVVRSLYDTVYNMNMAHLTRAHKTVFEHLDDAELRTACTTWLIYRGRTRHDPSGASVYRRIAEAAQFRHAVYGAGELFYADLFDSRNTGCTSALGMPGQRDRHTGCVGAYLVEHDLIDFLLFSLPDNDHHSHKYGPEAQVESIARADAAFAELADAAGGLDSFLERNAVVLLADHAQTRVEHPLALAETLAADWRVLEPNVAPDRAELAVSPIARAAAVYVLAEGRRAERAHAGVRDRLRELDGIDLFAWRAEESAVVDRGGAELRFRPGSRLTDRRGRGWDTEGDLAAVAAGVRDGRLDSEAYPDPLGRLWAALHAPNAGDILISAAPGYELVDWGGVTHCPGGSHGSLGAGDSLGPLVLCGLEPGPEATREQWAIGDVAELVLGHFGIPGDEPLAVRHEATAAAVAAGRVRE